ncbi:hypothetical protein DQ04_10051000 [Trypanosoma grayi]|uniref:hypothetical protein n=1 Tax=Trypanosoma grayi TaxID=71804 RepID=UPI0004F45A4A|nr:hypothetical protein DQ04_10051000 [Trypanosoma grayi]KEG07356.1 hypothetical protein DQ04_10051000 [Trypanosoma grayi]
MLRVTLAGLIALLVVSGESMAEIGNVELIGAEGCPLDHFYDMDAAVSSDGNQGENELCRPFTDPECTEKYGIVTVFNIKQRRCVWTLPSGATPPHLQAVPNAAVNADRCALLRVLHAMLTTVPPEGLRVFPLTTGSASVVPLHCGRVDLRQWALDCVFDEDASVTPLAVNGTPLAKDGPSKKQEGRKTPAWVFVILVVLSGIGAVTLSAIVFMLWPILSRTSAAESSHSEAATMPELCEEEPTLVVNSSLRADSPCESRTTSEASSGSSSPSSATQGTLRPSHLLDASAKTSSPLSKNTSVFVTPRDAKMDDDASECG